MKKIKMDNMNNPKLIKSSEKYEVWECDDKKLHVDKKYSMGIGFVPETYWFNDDFYHSSVHSWETMYTIHGKSYTIEDYISLEKWCRAVGFIE